MRLLPIFIVISCLLFAVFQRLFNFSDGNDSVNLSSTYDYLTRIINFNLYETGSNEIMQTPYIFEPIYNWLRDNIFADSIGNSQIIYHISFNILSYELILSIMFLMFDLFNFIISVGNKFINKGENYD